MRIDSKIKNKIEYGKKFFDFYNRKCGDWLCSKVNLQHGSDDFFIRTSHFVTESFQDYLKLEACFNLRLPTYLAQFLISNTQSTSDEMKEKTVGAFEAMLMQILQHFKRTGYSQLVGREGKAGPDYPRFSPGPSGYATLRPR